MRHNPDHVSFIMLVLTTTLVFASCEKEESNPTRPPEANYNGHWAGTTQQNKQLSFNVENNAITSVKVSYSIQDGNFNFSRLDYYKSLGTAVSIAADSFKVRVTVPTSGLDVESFSVYGRFDTESDCSGTLVAGCFVYDMSGGQYHVESTDWYAAKQ